MILIMVMIIITDYEMVQPALVVLDANGAATQKWSWKLMGLEDEKYGTGQYGSAMTMVPNPDGEGEVRRSYQSIQV